MEKQVKPAAPAVPLKKRRHKPHAAAHHGGAWKVAYADFITTMMALFLLLWLLNASDATTKNLISLYFRDPGIFENPQGSNILSGVGTAKRAQVMPILELVGPGGAGQGGARPQITLKNFEAVTKEVLRNSENRGIESQVLFIPTPDGLLVQLVDAEDQPLFPAGKTELTPRGRFILEQLGSLLALLPSFELVVSGHTDGHPFPPGSPYTNWDLSLDRAQKAAHILILEGMLPEKIVAVAGYGDTRPFREDDRLDPRNRRITFLLKRVGAAPEGGGLHAGPERAPEDAPDEPSSVPGDSGTGQEGAGMSPGESGVIPGGPDTREGEPGAASGDSGAVPEAGGVVSERGVGSTGESERASGEESSPVR